MSRILCIRTHFNNFSHPKIEAIASRRITVAPSMAACGIAIIWISFVSRPLYSDLPFFSMLCICVCVCVTSSLHNWPLWHRRVKERALAMYHHHLEKKVDKALSGVNKTLGHELTSIPVLKGTYLRVLLTTSFRTCIHVCTCNITFDYAAWVAWMSRYQYTRSPQNPV
jgi:hypothetical protein